MVRHQRWMLSATVGMTVVIGGCCHTKPKCAVPPPPPPPTAIIQPGPAPVPGQFAPAPQPGVQINPNIRSYPPYQSFQDPQPQMTWQPSPNVRLGTPRFESPEPTQARAQSPETPRMPEASDKAATSPALPVGIPRYNKVTEQVAGGLRPFADGYDWLKENGFRAVLHIRAPGQDDSAERQEVQKRSLRYLSLEVSPDTLSKKIVSDFFSMVDDKANQPLFVFDRDGILAGALWYLYLRGPAHLPDVQAKEKAGQLGFKEAGTEEHKLLWLAIQKYLSDQP